MQGNDAYRIASHPLLGTRRVYRADMPKYDPTKDTDGGTLVLGAGMEVTVCALFHSWNNIRGLEMVYVFCNETKMATHVPPKDLGVTAPLLSKIGA